MGMQWRVVSKLVSRSLDAAETTSTSNGTNITAVSRGVSRGQQELSHANTRPSERTYIDVNFLCCCSCCHLTPALLLYSV